MSLFALDFRSDLVGQSRTGKVRTGPSRRTRKVLIISKSRVSLGLPDSTRICRIHEEQSLLSYLSITYCKTFDPNDDWQPRETHDHCGEGVPLATANPGTHDNLSF
jgi:hypothetical protein